MESRIQDWLGFPYIRGTQRQFLENICSEDDLRSTIFRTFVVKFLACAASPRIFENLKFFREPLFLADIYEKLSFDP